MGIVLVFNEDNVSHESPTEVFPPTAWAPGWLVPLSETETTS